MGKEEGLGQCETPAWEDSWRVLDAVVRARGKHERVSSRKAPTREDERRRMDVVAERAEGKEVV